VSGAREAENRDWLMAALADAHEQMVARDAAFHAWEEELRRRDERIARLEEHTAELEDELRDAGEHIRHLTATIDAMRKTRAWRLATRYWDVRDRVKSLVRSR
jgi:chromosome segregation ATPase